MDETESRSTTAVELKKLFVGGLSWATKKESLEDYFSNFGEVTDCVVMIDAKTKTPRPRGFGFVTFADDSSVVKVLNQKEHILDEKKIDPKRAFEKGHSGQPKLFIGGLSMETTEESLRKYFKHFQIPGFGNVNVLDIDIKKDKSGNSKRFGFIVVQSEDCVRAILSTGSKFNIDGKDVEFKRALPQAAKNDDQLQQKTVLYPQNPSMAYVSAQYPPMSFDQHRSATAQYHSNPNSYYPTQAYYNYGGQQSGSHSGFSFSGSGQYNSRSGYGGQPQMAGNMSSEAVSYSQTTSTYSGNDTYNTSGMNYPYGPTGTSGYQFSTDQGGGGIPSNYSRMTRYPNQSGGGMGSSSHGHTSYSNYQPR